MQEYFEGHAYEQISLKMFLEKCILLKKKAYCKITTFWDQNKLIFDFPFL